MMLNQIVWTVLLSASTASTRPNAPPSPPNAPSPTGAGNPGKPGDFKSTCASIASIASKLAVEDVQVQLAQFVAAGTNLSLPDNDPSCAQSSIVVTADICRIALSVSTSHRSSISMEAWLPSNWTGRFLSGGNGGLNGCIDYSNLAYTSSLGFSSVGTNNGHNGTSGEPFLNNPDVVADFAYRA
jgi:feruloyl esterase